MIDRRLGPARVVFTHRHGGVSRTPYDTANLSTAVGDDADAVSENRRRLASTLGFPDPAGWWFLRQVHGTDVVVADGPPPSETPAADAAITACRALPLVVLVADCAPIALAGDDSAGVVHAGWKGLLAGVVERAVAALRARSDADVHALLGPCIHPTHYEFGRRELDRLVDRFGPEVATRTEQGALALDLPTGVRCALANAGVHRVEDVDVCTAASPDYFSHRRDGTTGRQAMVVVLDA